MILPVIDFTCIEYIIVGAMVKKSEDPFSKERPNIAQDDETMQNDRAPRKDYLSISFNFIL